MTDRSCCGTSSSPGSSARWPGASGRATPPTFPYALGVLFGVQLFYLLLINGPARPFATLAAAPVDGRGPSPLLQNHPLMAVHPPFLYLGFIGFTVPFAFGIAALLAGPGPSSG